MSDMEFNKLQLDQCMQARSVFKKFKDFSHAQISIYHQSPGHNGVVIINIKNSFITRCVIGLLLQFYNEELNK